MSRLSLTPLSAGAFAPYGEVIDTATECESFSINEGRTERRHALARVDCSEQGGRAIISVFRAEPVDEQFTLRTMERHPLGSQAFINISANPYAVVVAPPGDLDETAVRGFLAAPGQSISYHRGTWHHYLLALRAPSDFVVVDREGPGENCDEQPLRHPLTLDLS